MKALSKAKVLLVACIILSALTVSSLVVFAATAIWSPLSNPLNTDVVLPASLSAVTWNGTKSSDTIALSTTISPTPTHQQNVKFYVTMKADANSQTPAIESLTGNWETNLMLLGTVVSTGSTAKITIPPNTLSSGDTFFFIAEIVTPT